MILQESRTLKWIEDVSKRNHAADKTLVEKTIRALSLVEALSRSGLDFCFKGGSCLLLHFGSTRRLSIDADIICPPGTDLEKHFGMYAEEYGFTSVVPVERVLRTGVPKTHAKYFYQASYKTNTAIDKILLDVLFEEVKYKTLEKLPITSPFLKTDGDDIMVTVPGKSDLLGDKLTAFAPHTTGIPFYKGGKNCSMEIIKQMYDVASLFDVVDDFGVAAQTYRNLVKLELEYRHREGVLLEQVAMDAISAAQCISTYGVRDEKSFDFYTDGIDRVKNFIHSERYIVPSAVRNAAKSAYAAACLLKEIAVPKRYDGNPGTLRSLYVAAPLSNKLNKLKKTNPEAFFYWFQTYELLK